MAYVNYEDVYLKSYCSPKELQEGLKKSSGFTMRGGLTNRWAKKARWSSTE